MPGRYVFGRSNSQVGDQPASIAVCDFNNDGVPDIASSSGTQNIISIRLGSPDGSLTDAPDLATSASRGALACGDFDGDGKADLAVAEGNGVMLMFSGNGDGTFGPPKQYPTAPGATALYAADLKRDGTLALIVAGGGPQIQVYYGNGDGSLSLHGIFTVDVNGGQAGPNAIAVADLNNDGKPDIVVALNQGISVLIARSNGNGFNPYVRYPLADAYANGVVLTDFNGDHKMDVAVAATPSNNSNNGVVAVMLGAGDGTFLPATNFATAYYPRSIAVTDLNGDGKADLITANPISNTFSVLLGQGNGTFSSHADYATGPNPLLGLGDFNGDAKLDLLIASEKCQDSQCGLGNLAIILGKGDATFPIANYAAPVRTSAVVAADFNGHGNADLAIGNDNQQNNNTLSVLLNNGSGGFLPRTDYVAGSGASGVVAGDFNHDLSQDLAVANILDSTVSVLLGNGDGTFQNHVDYPTGTMPQTVLTGDFNNDGILDLVTVPNLGSAASVLLGNGDGTFQPHAESFAGPNRYSGAAGDFDRDGNLDLVVTSAFTTNNAMLLRGNGDGTFQLPTQVYPDLTGPYVATGDFNGDGKLDLAFTGPGGYVKVALGNGDGTFQAPVLYASTGSAFSIQAVDVDGDGNLDLVTLGYNEVGVLFGKGDGTFRTAVDYSATLPIPTGLAFGNIAGYGAADMAVANWSSVTNSGQVTVLLNPPAIALYPSNYKFPTQVIGDASAPQNFLISNAGSAPLNLSNIKISGIDYSQTNTCPPILDVGLNCTINVIFTPSQYGLRTGIITVQDDALAGTQFIRLAGIGQSAIGISDTSFSFAIVPPGQTTTRQVSLMNRGNEDITINNISIVGPNKTEFAESDTCGGTIVSHTSCTMTLTFQPTKTGTKLAAVVIYSTDPAGPQSIVLHAISRR